MNESCIGHQVIYLGTLWTITESRRGKTTLTSATSRGKTITRSSKCLSRYFTEMCPCGRKR